MVRGLAPDPVSWVRFLGGHNVFQPPVIVFFALRAPCVFVHAAKCVFVLCVTRLYTRRVSVGARRV